MSEASGQPRGAPVAIVDIGSNSVRLVAFEALGRSLVPIFNEKVLCGLGRGVATTGLLAEEAIDKAIVALKCFRLLCRQMGIADITVLATAATREARNGPAFLAVAREAIGADIVLVAGAREAELSALGVMSGVHRPDGLVGDLGGGSLELIDIAGREVGAGVSLPLGGLALSDLSKGSPKRAVRLVRDAVAELPLLPALAGRTFYAVGGTWRALAKLQMNRSGYPLHVVQGYVLPADPALFSDLVETEREGSAIASVSSARRPLLAYGAIVLAEIVRLGQPREVVVSTLGVREGMLFERLPAQSRALDPLLVAAGDWNRLRARSPGHGEDLCRWSDSLLHGLAVDESADERRLRHAACLLSDIAWRAHPDDRGAHALATIVNAAFVGVTHPDRCFLGLAIYFRHEGLEAGPKTDLSPLLSPDMLDRARLLAGIMRIAFQLSAAMGGVLPAIPLTASPTVLTLQVPGALADVVSQRVQNRLKQLAKMLGREAAVLVGF